MRYAFSVRIGDPAPAERHRIIITRSSPFVRLSRPLP
jgi:hypothetical protein